MNNPSSRAIPPEPTEPYCSRRKVFTNPVETLAAVQNKRAANGCKDVVKQVALAGGGVVFIGVFGIHDVLCLVLRKWEK